MVKALKSETWQDLINCLNSSLDMTLFLANLICNSFVIATVLAATTEDFHQSGSFFIKWFTCFWQNVIANKPPIMQIFPFSKFELISSDYWFKSHGQKVNFQSRNSYLFGLKFSASGQIEAEILSVDKSARLVACLLKQFAQKRWSTWVKKYPLFWESSV